MTKTVYTYIGSTRANHGKIVSLGYSLGLQNSRKVTIGEKIAQLANEGNERAAEVCAAETEFFGKSTK